jgi:hypothetical protein
MFSKMVEKRREKVVAKVTPDLRAGEHVQAAVFAQSGRSVTLGGALTATYYWIVVTDQRILLYGVGKMKLFDLRGIERELPRHVRLGPPKTSTWFRPGWYLFESLGMSLQVGFGYWSEIRTADSALN